MKEIYWSVIPVGQWCILSSWIEIIRLTGEFGSPKHFIILN